MPRGRVLNDPATGKTWATLLEGARTEIRQGTPGRVRGAAQQPDDAEAAQRGVFREEWARLKKGMVLGVVQKVSIPGAPGNW